MGNQTNMMMKLAIASLVVGSAAAFAPAPAARSSTAVAFSKDDLPGALPPMGFFAPVGFLVGEKVEGSTFLFDSQITGCAIDQIPQVPIGFSLILLASIGFGEIYRANTGWLDPADAKFDNPGQLKDDYYPGDIGFDPLMLKPEDPEEFEIMQTKELQNGRLAMLAAAGFLAQEAVDHQGILEHLAKA